MVISFHCFPNYLIDQTMQVRSGFSLSSGKVDPMDVAKLLKRHCLTIGFVSEGSKININFPTQRSILEKIKE
jgi:hypothetical protein